MKNRDHVDDVSQDPQATVHQWQLQETPNNTGSESQRHHSQISLDQHLTWDLSWVLKRVYDNLWLFRWLICRCRYGCMLLQMMEVWFLWISPSPHLIFPASPPPWEIMNVKAWYNGGKILKLVINFQFLFVCAGAQHKRCVNVSQLLSGLRVHYIQCIGARTQEWQRGMMTHSGE